ncbi:MAG: hypothetical protein M3126_04070 [Candidatus Eremiobacteraeota bacterium]|nr:hypothetical protein [Candidatus Eremiobacteraeota bacterium]
MTWQTWLLPTYSFEAQALYRMCYAVILFAQLAMTAVSARRFFTSEAYGGYVQASPLRNRLYHPRIVFTLCALWLGCTLALFFDRSTFIAALLNYGLCRFLLIDTRWVSLSRGFGAVGHITLWTAGATAILELTRLIDHGGLLRSAALLTFRVDLGLIMIVAGFYKVTAGYARGNGWEIALANPWWSYWANTFAKFPPRSIFFSGMNHMAYIVEIGAGICMLTPLHFFGAIAIAASFVMLGLTLRLTFLPEMVVVSTLLFIDPGSAADRFVQTLIHQTAQTPVEHGFPGAVALIIAIALWLSIPLGVLVRAALLYNFYRRKRVPGLQAIVDALASWLLITLWRVFTADIIEFYIEVYLEGPQGLRSLYSRQRFLDFERGLRYAHAGEFVALCTTFTALKYFSHEPAIFEQRLLRYARTLPVEPGGRVVFRFIRIAKALTFTYTPVADFLVDPRVGTITEQQLSAEDDVRRTAPGSPIFRGSRVGSYAPPK